MVTPSRAVEVVFRDEPFEGKVTGEGTKLRCVMPMMAAHPFRGTDEEGLSWRRCGTHAQQSARRNTFLNKLLSSRKPSLRRPHNSRKLAAATDAINAWKLRPLDSRRAR